MFPGLSKAFDILDYQILLDKLHHYGIRDLARNWFHNYLTERTQQVKTNRLELKMTKSQNNSLELEAFKVLK